MLWLHLDNYPYQIFRPFGFFKISNRQEFCFTTVWLLYNYWVITRLFWCVCGIKIHDHAGDEKRTTQLEYKSARGPFTMVRAFTVNSWNLVFFQRCFNIYLSRCRFEKKKWYRWRQRSMHRYQISSSLIMICEKMYIWFARQLLLVFIIFKDFSTGLSDC